MTQTTVTVLAPAYNEESVIDAFVAAALPAMQAGWELLIVDDGSIDKTPQLLSALRETYEGRALRVITHDENRGLGAALATGFAATDAEIVVTIDADLSHPLTQVAALVAACRDADAAFASRFIAGGSMTGVPVLRRWISGLGNLVFRLLFWSPVRDMTTGFRAYRNDALADLDISGSGFETQLEIAVRLVCQRSRIVEIPLRLGTRAAGASKMRYLQILPRYGRMTIRMLLLRWSRIGRRPKRIGHR